jgi:hypothetical protein
VAQRPASGITGALLSTGGDRVRTTGSVEGFGAVGEENTDAHREAPVVPVVPVDPGLQVFGGVRAYRRFVRDHRISLVYSLANAGIRFRRLKEAQR